MREFDFDIICINNENKDICEIADLIYGDGGDDCLVSSCGNEVTLSFDREAKSFAEAVHSAIEVINKIHYLTIQYVKCNEDYSNEEN